MVQQKRKLGTISLLKKEFEDAQSKGHRVNFGWLWSNTRRNSETLNKRF